MIHSLKIIDDIEMSHVTNIDDADYPFERTQSSRSNNFHILSFKQLLDTKTSPPQEQ